MCACNQVLLHKSLRLAAFLLSTQKLRCWQGPALMQFTQLGGDSIAVIWTMVERHDPDSHWAAFWQSLPETLHSGLTMSDTLLQALQGTSAHTECHSARQVRKHHHSQ